MTDKIEKPRPLNEAELGKIIDPERLKYLSDFQRSNDVLSNMYIAARMQGVEAELSGLRQNIADLKGIFGRIATAMEEANAIKREESAPPKKAAGKLSKIEKK